LRKTLNSRWLPWALLSGLILGEAAYLVFRPLITRAALPWNQVLLGASVFIGLLLAYLLVNRVLELYEQREQLQLRLVESEKQAAKVYDRFEAILQVAKKGLDASDESEVIDLVLRLSADQAGAKGASFVPLDDHGQPMAVSRYGELPSPVIDPWLEYLASPKVRDQCQACEQHDLTTAACPLLNTPLSDTAGVFCLPLKRGEREFGKLNLYMSLPKPLDLATQAFLSAISDETALALDGIRLRQRELTTLRQIQGIRQKAELPLMMENMLENIYSSTESDAALLIVRPHAMHNESVNISCGEMATQMQPFIEGIMNGVIESGKPLFLGDVAGVTNQEVNLRSFMAAPLQSEDRRQIGAILIGSRRPQGFSHRQLGLLQTVAGQVNLMIHNAERAADLEFAAMMEERKRLAREIHDGLAQTLGFLKLQAAQMKNLLEREDFERIGKRLDEFYETLREAYQDARLAIDGLRIGVGENGLLDWLDDTAAFFQETSGLPVRLCQGDPPADLPPEIQAQLMRIVQEALSNIRKHAQASQVAIEWFIRDGEFWLEIQDDGLGFSPEDVSGAAQHGLRGIRERSDLIGAEFQVISRPGEGTIVRLRLPMTAARKPEAAG
jgi:two-component system, NarL family, nitrate/nitrite sensor histidine kinase NarX